ncbi:J domain-containing protein [Mycolicibacter longobardus]|uniref:J domain-containing protein n=1 Tax=Mycolicibacter longobardus TaxID=1108812 RepID=UPI0021F373A8|nr:J domain-containing protein [Mycolicibacter longobardus]MCV7383671.1 J domain-containing protein [Mycolicibacter longobardus]
MSQNPDPYAVLGVTRTAPPAEISHAFRTKLRALHPDTGNAGVPPTADAQAQLRQLLRAYNLLRRGQDDAAADPPRPTRPAGNPHGPVSIPVTYRRRPAAPPRKDLWAGPVRRHR